jgi:hypothetical protein
MAGMQINEISYRRKEVRNQTKIILSKSFIKTLLYIKSVKFDLLNRIIDWKMGRIYFTLKSQAKFTDKSKLLEVPK